MLRKKKVAAPFQNPRAPCFPPAMPDMAGEDCPLRPSIQEKQKITNILHVWYFLGFLPNEGLKKWTVQATLGTTSMPVLGTQRSPSVPTCSSSLGSHSFILSPSTSVSFLLAVQPSLHTPSCLLPQPRRPRVRSQMQLQAAHALGTGLMEGAGCLLGRRDVRAAGSYFRGRDPPEPHARKILPRHTPPLTE